MTDHSRQILACSRIANDYAVSARENLCTLAAEPRPYGRMRPFNVVRMLAAHRIEAPAGLTYGVLHAGNISGRTEPLSLELESLIHGSILALEASALILAQPEAPAGLAAEFADRMEVVAIASIVLAEALRHAAAVEASEETRMVVMRRLNMHTERQAAAGSDELLDQAIDGHKRRLRAALQALIAATPDSRRAAERARSVRAAPYPLWMIEVDHAGSQVINNVWLPKPYAEQLLAHRSRKDPGAKAVQG